MSEDGTGAAAAACAALFAATALTPASAQDADEIAKKLSNPVASMISVPFQFNADFGVGPDTPKATI